MRPAGTEQIVKCCSLTFVCREGTEEENTVHQAVIHTFLVHTVDSMLILAAFDLIQHMDLAAGRNSQLLSLLFI